MRPRAHSPWGLTRGIRSTNGWISYGTVTRLTDLVHGNANTVLPGVAWGGVTTSETIVACEGWMDGGVAAATEREGSKEGGGEKGEGEGEEESVGKHDGDENGVGVVVVVRSLKRVSKREVF